MQARALAGEWYDWFTGRHAETPSEDIERRRDTVHEALRSSVSEDEFERLRPKELWDMEDVREIVRPVLVDVGETAQFLAVKRTALTTDARDLFLDHLYDDLAEALKLLLRRAEGDYSPDTYRKRFPKTSEGADSGLTPVQLFEKWIAERKPAYGTYESWRYVFAALGEQFKDRSAGSILPEEAEAWIRSLIGPGRSEATVKKTWLTAANRVFRWALEHNHVPRNPFAAVKVTVPKKAKLRETRAFRPPEARMILQAASAITDTRSHTDAAKRWVPWLCAYTGARVGEMTQLRKQDIVEQDGIWAVRITPEAGTVKGGEARTVPLHAASTSSIKGSWSS
jgi:integrase